MCARQLEKADGLVSPYPRFFYAVFACAPPRCYLCAKQPDKADELLSAFFKSGTACTPPDGDSGDGATETPGSRALRGGNAQATRFQDFAGDVSQAELSTARLLTFVVLAWKGRG